MNIGQKILATIGILGVLLLTPIIFYTFGNTGPMDVLSQHLGALGDPSILTFVAFCMIGTAALLGGGKNMSATLVSILMGCLLISTAVEINFLHWFKSLTANVEFLSNLKLNLLTGLFIVLVGMFLSFTEKVGLGVELVVLILLPIGFLVGSNHYQLLPENPEFNLSMNKGMESLKGMIDAKYMEQENVQEYVEEVENNASLTEAEKVAKIQGLQGKIDKLESDKEILARLRKENEQYRRRIEDQEATIKEYGWCAGSRDSSTQVKDFKDAVVSNQPCVRDFAVSLVKNQEGSYANVTRGLPSPEGIKQICALHAYLASNWKYISDPTMIRNDYYSPANRTIALGLAGDCDDFAILNAACIEAIGGIARIEGGFCTGGGHAWGEVLIGQQSDWNRAKKLIRQYYKDNTKKIEPNIDKDGLYWLPLDWEMGQYTCNSYSNKQVELYTSIEQLTK